MSPIDIDPVTGAPIVTVVVPNNDNASNKSGEFAVSDGSLSDAGNAANNSTTVNSENGTDKTERPISSESAGSESNSDKTIKTDDTKSSQTEILNSLDSFESAKTESEPIESVMSRRREAQYRAIDRILRLGGMDSQQSDKAMVEIRRILSN